MIVIFACCFSNIFFIGKNKLIVFKYEINMESDIDAKTVKIITRELVCTFYIYHDNKCKPADLLYLIVILFLFNILSIFVCLEIGL